jgi:hypothetical protein
MVPWLAGLGFMQIYQIVLSRFARMSRRFRATVGNAFENVLDLFLELQLEQLVDWLWANCGSKFAMNF